MKVLIAEDDPNQLILQARRMAARGHVCDLAGNGRQAVELARRRRGDYDVCLMDIDMPVMNGIDAAVAMRRRVAYFPILACSANPGYRMLCARVGIDDFIEKPFSAQALFARLGALVVRWLRLQWDHDNLNVIEEKPVDRQHAQELRELAKQNLRKVIFFDTPGRPLIVHKNVLNKISHDFNVKKQAITTFINRDPEKPTLCQLYRHSHYLMPQAYITEEEYAALLADEDSEMARYERLALQVSENGPGR